MSLHDSQNRVVLSVPNISCGHCVQTIVRELSRLNDIVSVTGNAEKKVVVVEYRGDLLDEIKRTLEDIGYPAV